MYKHVFLHHPRSVREDCWPWVSKMSTTSRCLYKGWTNMATEKNESAWRLSVVSVLSLCPRIWVRAELLLFEWKPNIGELLGSLGYGKGCVVESCWQDYWRWKQGCIIGDELLESNYWRDIIGCHLLETISWRLGCGFGNMHEYGSNFQGHHLIFPKKPPC